eukprot:scaffold12639_cov45-Phaeocystis_antarctica.AAC.1
MARASTEARSALSSPSELGASSGRGGGSQPERRLAAARDLRLIFFSCEREAQHVSDGEAWAVGRRGVGGGISEACVVGRSRLRRQARTCF